jgi:E3 ubiquitin-protein ligase ZSWIM2
MARSCPYRREVSDACNWHQDEALNSTIFILHQTGPTGFLLKEEGEHKNFKVFLGDVHTCTCPVFKKEKDLCKHICWLLLKRFRVLRSDPLSWQLGLNEREINGIIRGDTAQGQQHVSRAKPVVKVAHFKLNNFLRKYYYFYNKKKRNQM